MRKPQPKPAAPQVTTSDPDRVQEVFCNGRLYVHGQGQFATLTFTHDRPDAAAMVDRNNLQFGGVVRARIVMPFSNLVALRDLLIRTIQERPPEGQSVQ